MRFSVEQDIEDDAELLAALNAEAAWKTKRRNKRYDRSDGYGPHHGSRTRTRRPCRADQGLGRRRGDRRAGSSSRGGHPYAAQKRAAYLGNPPAGEGAQLHDYTRS